MDEPCALIAEDNPNLATLFRQALTLAGFDTEAVYHGKFVLDRLPIRQPWLVVLDLDMPGVAESGALETICQDPRFRQIKVIAVTAYSQIADTLPVEPDLLLFKPVSMEQFSDFIARLQLKLKYQTTVPLLDEPWDRVTGLYNQVFFVDRLENRLIQARQTGQYSFAVIAINIDQNHSLRDQLDIRKWINTLCEVGATLKSAARPFDTVARFDQDNFYMLLEQVTDTDTLFLIASRIQQEVAKKLVALGIGVQSSIRTAVAPGGPEYQSAEDVFQSAVAIHSLQPETYPVRDQ
jgi:diguanylate cyclase (GGDEF)-like protein